MWRREFCAIRGRTGRPNSSRPRPPLWTRPFLARSDLAGAEQEDVDAASGKALDIGHGRLALRAAERRLNGGDVVEIYFGAHDMRLRCVWPIQLPLPEVLFRMTYPVNPFGFYLVDLHLSPPLSDARRDQAGQDPGLFGQFNDCQANQFQEAKE